MDGKLVSWARAVKARRDRGVANRRRRAVPVLFFFTDRRGPDAASVVRGLAAWPAATGGLFGVVVRGEPAAQAALVASIGRFCRAHAIMLLVAGSARAAAAARAGLHLPGGRRPLVGPRPGTLVSASAHDVAALRRARASGAALCFISPVFPTRSHPGARPLGTGSLARLMRHAGGLPVLALGGVDGASARALPRRVAGAAAIDAFR